MVLTINTALFCCYGQAYVAPIVVVCPAAVSESLAEWVMVEESKLALGKRASLPTHSRARRLPTRPPPESPLIPPISVSMQPIPIRPMLFSSQHVHR